jgi:hypothetical protein
MRVPLVSTVLIALLIGVAGRADPQASPDSARRDAIRELLRVQRTDSQMLAGMEQAFAQQIPDPSLPAGFMDSALARMRRNVGVFVERLVPVYDSLFTAEEIARLTEFFRSPVGQRYVAQQTAILAAASQIGERWGMEVAAEILLEMSRQPIRRP